jgi:glycine cleavage system H lipoate-binding protein/ferredoxin
MTSEKITGPVKLKFDDKEVTARGGQTILEAANAAGIRIPTLCHNEALTPYGACRLCSVEIVTKRGKKRMVASCLYPVEDGLTVLPNSERVIKSRKMIIELLLSRCPNAKILQDLADEYNLEKVRFKSKNENCILCGMCVRVCTERLGVGAIGFQGRGTTRKVDISFGDEDSDICVGCGACTYVCPTGAVQMESRALEKFRETIGGQARKCRYMMMGIVDYKLCSHDYRCANCEFDQKMEETFGTHPALVIKKIARKEPLKIKEFILEPELLYYKGHLWARRINGRLQVGLDDFARKLLGNIDNLLLLSPGSNVQKGETLLEINIKDKNVKILSPVTGKIFDINPDVRVNPDIISRDPYRLGWIFTIKPEINNEINELLCGYNAQEWFKSDAEKLHAKFKKMSGVTITEGSEIASTISSKLSPEDWKRLVNDFFTPVS